MDRIPWLTRLIRRIFRFGLTREPAFDTYAIEEVLGYHFKNPSLLFMSLKHRSYSQVKDGSIAFSNERLEFLGDSVLNMVVSHYLFERNPTYQEGDLTKMKSIMVSKTSNALACKKTGIDRFILLSNSEEDAGGRGRTSIIADTFEAVIGAIFIDGGLPAAEGFIRRTVLSEDTVLLKDSQTNYKSILLELTQSRKLGHPLYHTISEDGPDHDKSFTVEVFVGGISMGIGKGKNKKAAQQLASKGALEKMNCPLPVE
jgi:ribonuclease III